MMPPSSNPLNARIVIVDDSGSLRSVLRTFFVGEGYRVVGEFGHIDGVADALERLAPDVICLDHHLPDGLGLDLLKALHKDKPGIAVVMMTGDGSESLEAEAAEAGASGFIRKPFSPEQVSREVRQVLHARTLHRRHASGEFAAIKARARAVVVDDSATMRMLLTAVLNHAHVEVVGEAADGKSGVDMVIRCSPDIVCLDMDMPVMNGLEALAQIHAKLPAARVLMITGRTGRESVMQAAKLGARGYILKPFEPDKVTEAIDRLLA